MGKTGRVSACALLGFSGLAAVVTNQSAADGAVASAIDPAPTASPVSPQPDSTDKITTELGTITVSAQRRDEKLNDVPVAVSAYTDRDRDALGITTIDDVARFTPSVSYQDYPNRLSIRGVGRFTNAIGSDPGVAIYNDGVYSPETGSLAQSSLFVDRIEVLNGPQGTLYGQNSIGGAVNVISKRPTADWQGEVRLDLGDYKTFNPSGSISGPINDFTRFKLTGAYADQAQGTIPNLSGKSLGRQRSWIGEAQIDFDLGANAGLWLKFSSSKAITGGLPNVMIDPYDTTTYLPGGALVPSPTAGYAVLNRASSKHYVVDENYPGGSRTKTNTFTAEYTYQFSGAELKYTAGWSNYRYNSSSDYDFSSRVAYGVDAYSVSAAQISLIDQVSQSYSNEITLTTTGEGGIKAIGGLYQDHERLEQPIALLDPGQAQLQNPLSIATFTPAAPNPSGLYYSQYAKLKTESYGLFGQVDFPLSDKLTLTTGLRYSIDNKFGDEAVRQIFWEPVTLATTVSPIVAACCSLDVTPSPNQRALSGSWDALTGRVALNYKPNPDTLIYGSLSKGYKSGGFNLGSLAANPTVAPEDLIAGEVGFKQRVTSTLQIDAAAYIYDYRHLQVLYNVIRSGVTQTDFVNADKARSYGLELQATWIPIPDLKILLNYSYLNAQFKNFCCIPDVASSNPSALQDLSGSTLPQSPRNKVALNAAYSIPLDRGSVTPSLTYSYVSEQYFAPFNTAEYRAPSFAQTDFRLIWEPESKRYLLIASVKNAFNEHGFNSLTLQGNYRVVTPYLPRMYGLELQFHF